jgi:hypothetical protein
MNPKNKKALKWFVAWAIILALGFWYVYESDNAIITEGKRSIATVTSLSTSGKHVYVKVLYYNEYENDCKSFSQHTWKDAEVSVGEQYLIAYDDADAIVFLDTPLLKDMDTLVFVEEVLYNRYEHLPICNVAN